MQACKSGVGRWWPQPAAQSHGCTIPLRPCSCFPAERVKSPVKQWRIEISTSSWQRWRRFKPRAVACLLLLQYPCRARQRAKIQGPKPPQITTWCDYCEETSRVHFNSGGLSSHHKSLQRSLSKWQTASRSKSTQPASWCDPLPGQQTCGEGSHYSLLLPLLVRPLWCHRNSLPRLWRWDGCWSGGPRPVAGVSFRQGWSSEDPHPTLPGSLSQSHGAGSGRSMSQVSTSSGLVFVGEFSSRNSCSSEEHIPRQNHGTILGLSQRLASCGGDFHPPSQWGHGGPEVERWWRPNRPEPCMSEWAWAGRGWQMARMGGNDVSWILMMYLQYSMISMIAYDFRLNMNQRDF